MDDAARRFCDALAQLGRAGESHEVGWEQEGHEEVLSLRFGLVGGVRVHLREGSLTRATLRIDRGEMRGGSWPEQNQQGIYGQTLDLIVRFLRTFPNRSTTRVRLACRLGALSDRHSFSPEVVTDLPPLPDLEDAPADGPDRELLEVIRGRLWSMQTADLEVANWRSGDHWRLDIKVFARGRWTTGGWEPQTRVAWAEELWAPHRSDGDDVAVTVRRAVAGFCAGEQSAEAAKRTLVAATDWIVDGSPLGLFVTSAHPLLGAWEVGELGSAEVLHELAGMLDRGSGVAWPMTLRERIRWRTPREWVPISQAADALADAHAARDDDPLVAVQNVITRFVLTDPDRPERIDIAEACAEDLAALRIAGRAHRVPLLTQTLAAAEGHIRDYVYGNVSDEELWSFLERHLHELRDLARAELARRDDAKRVDFDERNERNA